jgi:hypothetical protein
MTKLSLLPLLPHLTNVRGVQDRISSAALAEKFATAESNEPFVDRLYGHCWGFTPALGSAVYGETTRFKSSPLDPLAKGRFLRVPFRRIPVLEVRSLGELYELAQSFCSKDPNIKLMWRGQHREWLISRPPDESLRLFGEPKVAEPSLTPSVSRTGKEFDRVFLAWSAILDAFLRTTAHRHSVEVASFRSSYNYRLWAFATAQHYGLPSVGLDLTPTLDVAIFFALHQLKPDGKTGETVVTRVDGAADPVIYALGGFSHDLFDDAILAPEFLQCVRPKAQSAFFHGTGWGFASNKAAERIVLAIRLKDHATWRVPLGAEALFPASDVDPFLAFLLEARAQFAPIAKDSMLERVYYLTR